MRRRIYTLSTILQLWCRETLVRPPTPLTEYRLIHPCSRYLETLCDFLYDDLRPRILHEQRVNVLCEVCTVLQALMILGNDISTSGSTSDDEDANESVVPQTPADETESNGLQRLQIGQLLQMILQDAQTRLVFKAQAIIQSEIRLHIPTEKDLQYPEKLTGLFLALR